MAKKLENTEWTLTAKVAEIINAILQETPGEFSAFSSAAPELKQVAGKKRPDVTIKGTGGTEVAVIGEAKMPWTPAGQTPHSQEELEKAYLKAAHSGARYFFTTNFSRLVIWKTDDPGAALIDRAVEDVVLLDFVPAGPAVFDDPEVMETLRSKFRYVVERLHGLTTGTTPATFLPLDTLFIKRVEAALDYPIAKIKTLLIDATTNGTKLGLDTERWMREEQGWTVAPSARKENADRASRFTAYVWLNRLCFYNALRRKYSAIPRLTVPNSVKTSAQLTKILNKAFNDAKRLTGDYETVFADSFGDTLPFATDAVVDAWRQLVRLLDRYDFATISLDVIGAMYERLISPEERHKFGQHYTQPAVVDLLNAFAISDPKSVVMDPGCGGGTFLVRGYSRKKYLDPDLEHSAILQTIFGNDILQYACHLSTINLAFRDLIDEDNFPMIRNGDFLTYEPGKPFFQRPTRLVVGGMVTGCVSIPVASGAIESMVGNPPYSAASTMTKEEREDYHARARAEWPGYPWHRSSDLCVYFLLHAAKFVTDGGVVAFVLQAAWLDVEYGIPLQKWLLDNFEILAICEGEMEPWFSDARVAPILLICRRQSAEARRRKNLIRFVYFRSRIADLVAGPTDGDRHKAAETLRDAMLNIKKDGESSDWRATVVSQQSLLDDGTVASDYVGTSWGRLLRQGPVLRALHAAFPAQWTKLSTLADIERGVTTNCDKFFIVDDVTDDLREHHSTKELHSLYGTSQAQLDSGSVRLVRRRDGVVLPLDGKYLVPALSSARDIKDLSTKKIPSIERLVHLSEHGLSTRATRYVESGKKEGLHKSDTFNRAAYWYVLGRVPRPPILVPKTVQYSPVVILNDAKLAANQRLYCLTPTKSTLSPKTLCAVLNSTLIAAER